MLFFFWQYSSFFFFFRCTFFFFKDLFIGPKEFVVGYSKAPKQPQSSARPICHSHAVTRTGREPATIRTAAYGARNGRRHLFHSDQMFWMLVNSLSNKICCIKRHTYIYKISYDMALISE